MTITAAADGSALGNPGPAGWGWYVDEHQWACGGWPYGTNNMGELTAVLDLLRQTAHTGEDLLIYSDSKYVINSVTQWMPGWKRNGWVKKDRKPVLNVEIMKSLDAALTGRQVQFVWVKGHAGHPLNEHADRLANGAAYAYKDNAVPDPGPGIAGAPQGNPPRDGASDSDGASDGHAAANSERGGGPSTGTAEQLDLFSTFDR